MTEDELAHFGVKGMRWGQRQADRPMTQQEKTARLKQLDRKMDRLDMNKALAGIGFIGSESQKMTKKRLKKDANFTFKSLSNDEKVAWRNKSSAKAQRRAVRQGAFATGVLLGGGLLAVSKLTLAPQTMQGAQVSVALLSTIPLRSSISNISSIRTADKRQKILDERDELKAGRKDVR
jgi:hypothetical protein